MFKESLKALVGTKLNGIWYCKEQYIDNIDNSYASVSHDVIQLFNIIDLIGTIHTHPPTIEPYPSNIDIPTCNSWVSAIGNDFLCLIKSEYKLRAFVFLKEGKRQFRECNILYENQEYGMYIITM